MPYAAQAAVQQAPVAEPMPVDQELPPPPDGWTGQLFCAKCGQKSPADARFCEKCGAPMTK